MIQIENVFPTLRVGCCRLQRQEFSAVPLQSEVHQHGERCNLAAVQESACGRGSRPWRGATGRLHHAGATQGQTGSTHQSRLVPFQVLLSFLRMHGSVLSS